MKQRKYFKSLLSLVIAAAMIVTMLPMSAFADEAPAAEVMIEEYADQVTEDVDAAGSEIVEEAAEVPEEAGTEVAAPVEEPYTEEGPAEGPALEDERAEGPALEEGSVPETGEELTAKDEILSATVKGEATDGGMLFDALLTGVSVRVLAPVVKTPAGSYMTADIVDVSAYAAAAAAKYYGKAASDLIGLELHFYNKKGKEIKSITTSQITVTVDGFDAPLYCIGRVSGGRVVSQKKSAEPTFTLTANKAYTYVIAGLKSDGIKRANGKTVTGGKQSFTLNKGGFNVKVSAPKGAFSGKVTMEAEEVPGESVQDTVNETLAGEANTVVGAYDISFHNTSSGAELQPSANVTVTIETPLDMTKKYTLLHIGDDGKATVVEDAVFSESGVQYTAAAFSVYVISENDEIVTYRRKYKFTTNGTTPFEFYNKAGEKVSEQLIKSDDVLESVGSPYESGKEFTSWMVVSSGDAAVAVGSTLDLPCTIQSVTKDAEVVLKPAFGDLYYVTFHESPAGTTPDVIQTKKLADQNGSVVIGDVIAPQPDSTKIFYAWTDGTNEYSVFDNNGVLVPGTTISGINQDKDLYPVFADAFWLRFVAGETGSQAVYVPARFVREDDILTKLPVTTRKGYNFAGWYRGSMTNGQITYDEQVTDASGNVINPSSGLTLGEETTLYAAWNPKTDAQYTVILWRQKVSDNKGISESEKTYDYVTSEVRSGVTGDEVTSSDTDKGHSGGDYTGFHYARTVQNSETIRADGGTVINVYYDRDLMAINFYYKDGHQPSGAQTSYTYTSTTSNDGTQYGVLEDGSYIQLDKKTTSTTRVYYTYLGNQEYTGTFYTRSGPWYDRTYTATQYNGNNLPPADDNTTYYTEGFFIIGHQELTRQTSNSNVTSWSYTIDGVTYPYTGTRFTRSTNSTYPYMVTWTGLYGQSFDKYGYVWPKDYRWTERSNGGTTQTILTAFVQNTNPYNLYDQGSTGNSTIYHYKQGLDGKYSQVDNVTRFTAKGSGGNFNFENKFQGFDAATYSDSFSASGGSTSVKNSNGTFKEDVNVSYPLHVYHERHKWKITYKSEGTVVKTSGEIYYEDSMTSYNYTLAQAGLSEREHYRFTGWYADETCTQTFNFNDSHGMPDANVVVYAGWEPIWYQIIVDPNGGVITPDIGSTYMWKQYKDTISKYDITRTYIEDRSGTYKYVYVDGRNDPDGNISVRTATYETAEEGYTGTKYRPMTSNDPEYVLVGWYVVDENDNMTDTPYDFASEIEGPVTIRAKWRLAGSYRLQYNATNTVDNVEVSGTFTQAEPDAEYADGARIVVQSPPTDITGKYVFDGWYVEDNTSGEMLDDNGGSYYAPGDELDLNAAAWARNKIVHFKAHYTKVEESEDPVAATKLILDANGGAFGDVAVSTSEDAYPYISKTSDGTQVKIEKMRLNAETALAYYSDKVSREGYELIGWSTNADATDKEFDVDTIVGADEQPNKENTLYAVWEEKFYVFHSSDGTVDAYSRKDLSSGKFNIASKVKSGYLYGGYFKKYFNVTDQAAKTAACRGTTATTEFYTGAALYKKVDGKTVRYWTKADAYTDTVESTGGKGDAMTAKPGMVYYLREVPQDFLGLRVQTVYDTNSNNAIDNLYLITTTDNNIYGLAGFKVVTADKTATFYSSFSIRQRNSTSVTKIMAADINTIGGYVDVWEGTEELVTNAEANSTFSVKPFWTTLDGVRVDDTRAVRTFNIGDKTFGNGDSSLKEVK